MLNIERPFENPFPFLDSPLHVIVGAIDVLAIAVLLVGTARFTYWMIRGEIASSHGPLRLERQNLARLELGRYILAALELLIVADVIRTALSFKLEGLVFLAGLVAIRSVISWFLDKEIENLETREKHDPPS